MQITKNKIEKLFPSVYITLVSMLLGFAVEDVISQLRQLNSIGVLSILSGVSILSAIIAVWTGYSFISMTQERLPRFLDVLNPFFFAFCFYMLSSTLGHDTWYLFAALSIYMASGLFAFIYNARYLMKSVSGTESIKIFRGNIVLLVLALIIYPLATLLSKGGLLASSVEASLILYFFITNIIWTYFFCKGWSEIINNIG